MSLINVYDELDSLKKQNKLLNEENNHLKKKFTFYEELLEQFEEKLNESVKLNNKLQLNFNAKFKTQRINYQTQVNEYLFLCLLLCVFVGMMLYDNEMFHKNNENILPF